MKPSILALAVAACAALAVPARAQDAILVQHVVAVTVARTGGALVVTASGTVPVAGFASPSLRPRPDLARVEGAYVLDFVAVAPPRDKVQAQVETRLTATFRLEGATGEAVRVVQVRAALGSRTVQVPAGR